MLESDNGPALTKDVVASISRAHDDEAGTKLARQADESHSTFVQPQGVRFTPTIPQIISKKKKPKQKICKQGLDRYAALCDVVTVLANASSSLTLGQLIRVDGDMTKADIRHLSSRGARVCIDATAAVAAQKTRPRRRNAVQIKVCKVYDAKGLPDSGAVRSPIPEKLSKKLNVKGDRHPLA